MQALFIGLSTGAAVLLEWSYFRSLAYERPIHALILSFFTCAFVLRALQRIHPRLFDIHNSITNQYVEIPFKDYGEQEAGLGKDEQFKNKKVISSRRQFGLTVLAIVGLALRVELFRRISSASHCASRSYEVFIPLLLAINDIRHQDRAQVEIEEHADSSIYEAISEKLRVWTVRPIWRYVPPTLVVSLACHSITGLWQAQTSTYICPIGSRDVVLIPRLQQYALLIDTGLAIIADGVLRNNISQRSTLSLPSWISIVLTGAASCWVGYAILLVSFKPEYGHWMVHLDATPGSSMFFALFWQTLLFCTFSIATIYCIMKFGTLSVSLVLTTVMTVAPGLRFVWSTRRPFPPTNSITSIWTFLAIYAALWAFHRARQTLTGSVTSRKNSWTVGTLLILLVCLFPGIYKNNSVNFHPIDLLMYDAKAQHEYYLQYATHSKDLKTAVAVYRGKYECAPPPNFDVWWEFAQNRSALIIDDFDQIFLDLLPFRTIPPADIRRQTWEMVSNPWNEISGIRIRNGKAEVQENVLPTHRWMLEGVAIFMNSFAQYLPDMDLAFNLNDESRVAVPYEQISALRQNARNTKLDGMASWSMDRKSGWPLMAEEDYPETILENWSFMNTFTEFGAAGCPPDSPARKQHYVGPQPYLCIDCVSPHSVSQFVSNWSFAADPCHQPDLATLHGFYLSPAAFKTSRQLRPIFSQSKVHGYNDILYPSAWNYMDKVQYAPTNATGEPGTDKYSAGYPDLPFSQKVNTLYWRGATSEGVSDGSGPWQGMTRQRLVHMFNNLTNSHHDHSTVLLPDHKDSKKYEYRTLSARSLFDLGLSTDVQLVDHIARCGGKDCTNQVKEFALVGPSDFQAHWKYRYLFDMDGAGFSGRFLPFLQSHSLPFKTALFREWYDSRLTAWRHFVPQDIRLNGVWSTLAYFAGVDGVVEGKKIKSNAHVIEGELIAEEGREWAGKVLRKEDMEVYFFRLLLEWARLTDDRRDELGFQSE